MPLQIVLKAIKTRTELAEKLGVESKALDLVSLSSSQCTREGCHLSAVKNNHNRCILCRQTWYPFETKKGELPRGHGIYGPQFMRTYNNNEQKKGCCCSQPLCNALGYSHQGMFRLPADPTQCETFLRVLNIAACDRKKMIENRLTHMVAPWHYHSKHLMKGEDGKYKIRPGQGPGFKYWDADKVEFPFAPPNSSVKQYIENNVNVNSIRGLDDDSLPSWMSKLVKEQNKFMDPVVMKELSTPTNKSNKVPRISPTTTRRVPRKRASPEQTELETMREHARIMQAQLNSQLDQIKGLSATVEVLKNENIRIRIERDNLLDINAELNEKIVMLEESKCFISYDELKPGGILSDHVNDFTFFPSFASNDAFLDLINYTEGCPEGDGLCQNLVRYSKVSVAERKKYNDELKAAKESTQQQQQDDEDDDNMSISSDAGTGLSEIADEAMEEAANPSPKGGRRRKLDWKTEYLIYCFYAKCNLSMRRTAALFGIGTTLVHDIVYAWANVLCLTLGKMFPVPTRSQMLRAYPKSVLKKFGHAKIFMLLDATEVYADIASMKTVNSILYSAYKHHSTLKGLAGCDPIGIVWDESISSLYPGSISDVVFTSVSKVLEQIPFGCAVEVDKGFLIENDCALIGVICIRPMKMMKGQTQQSKEDAHLTQKVGKTRIPVEQVNGQMKRTTGFFDKNVRVDQIGLADLIFRAGYLLTNFKLPFIQGRSDKAPKEGSPCGAEVRWYDETDDGLVDIRPEVELWGCESEIRRWYELRNMPCNKDLSKIEISELVLDEDWPSKLRERHRAKLTL